MAKVNLKAFLMANNLKQQDMVNFLGVSKPYISYVCSGLHGLSEDKLNLLLNNDKGWETSALLTPFTPTREDYREFARDGKEEADEIKKESDLVLALQKENALLREQLQKAEDDKQKYWEMIQRLMENK